MIEQKILFDVKEENINENDDWTWKSRKTI